jgi:hypothetical protein
MLIILIATTLLSFSQGQFTSTYQLDFDEDEHIYTLEVFVGSKLESRRLVLDTLSNGTAIDYNY